MRWEDERYVRVYTRDTPDWLALGWEAQSLLVLTFRKMDRAGILELGRSGNRGLAALVGMPVEVVERALPILLDDGCLQLNGTTLVAPNFIEAQETPQSDAQRQRESRARARARATSQNVTPESRNVTSVTDSVTRGHAASHAVTPNCAVPCRAVPCSSALDARETPAPEAADLGTPAAPTPTPETGAKPAPVTARGRRVGFVSTADQMVYPHAAALHDLLAETWPEITFDPGSARALEDACVARGGTAAFAVACKEFAERKGETPGSTKWFARCLASIGQAKAEQPRGRKAMGAVGTNWDEKPF